MVDTNPSSFDSVGLSPLQSKMNASNIAHLGQLDQKTGSYPGNDREGGMHARHDQALP